MRLALIGADETTLAVARAAAADRRFELVAICEPAVGSHSAELAGLGLSIPEFDSWDALLDSDLVDAVVVARGPDEDLRAEQLRKLAQVAMPVLAAHPVFDAMIVYYEIEMIRRDTGAVLLPYLPDRLHPAIVELERLFASRGEGPIGTVEQVVFERHLAARDKQAVLARFAHDVDTLRAVCGEINRLGASGAGLELASYGSLSVQMAGPAGVPARWSVAPAHGHNEGRLMLLGSTGRAVVTMPAEGPWQFELAVAGSHMNRQLDDRWNPAATALERLAAAVHGERVRPSWLDAARSAELSETIAGSLRRGRTIELHFEEHSEESTFKGIMAAVGCGVLILGLVFLVVVAVVEDLGRAVGKRVPFVARWPYILLGLLGLFLILQFLLLAMRRDKSKPAGSQPDDAHDGGQF